MIKTVTLSLLLGATTSFAHAQYAVGEIMLFQKNDLHVFEYVITKDHSICALSVGIDPMIAFMKDGERSAVMAYVNNKPARKFEYMIDDGLSKVVGPSDYDNFVAESKFNMSALDELAKGSKLYLRAWPKLKIDEDKRKILGLMFSQEAVMKFKECVANQ